MAGELRGFDHDGQLEREFRRSLDSRPVACYHATRLLPHELENIRRDGLFTQNDELHVRKLADARLHHPDVLSDDNGPLGWRPEVSWNGAVCFVTSQAAVIGGAHGLGDLLAHWGGAAIARQSGNVRCSEVFKALDQVSLAAVVEFGLNIDHFAGLRPLWFVPVGVQLGLPEPWAASRTSAHIPADRILRVFTADHPDWPAELSA